MHWPTRGKLIDSANTRARTSRKAFASTLDDLLILYDYSDMRIICLDVKGYANRNDLDIPDRVWQFRYPRGCPIRNSGPGDNTYVCDYECSDTYLDDDSC